MIKKNKENTLKLTKNINYRIIDSTLYLLLSSNTITKEELNIAYKKITLIVEDNNLSYINISGKHLEDNKKFFQDLGFTLSYYDVNKLNYIFEGVQDKKAYKCYGLMTKKDFYNKYNQEEIKTSQEKIKIISPNSGYINNLLLLFGGIILLCFFCMQGAIYLIK